MLCLVPIVRVGAVATRPLHALPNGAAAPPVALPDLSGKLVQSASWKGKPVVLNFWAFWCDTWKAEMPDLQALAARQGELGFQLAAISVDGTRVQEFSRRAGNKTTFPVLLDVGGKVSAAYHIRQVPTVVVIDKHGKILLVRSGYPGNDVVLDAIRQGQ